MMNFSAMAIIIIVLIILIILITIIMAVSKFLHSRMKHVTFCLKVIYLIFISYPAYGCFKSLMIIKPCMMCKFCHGTS